MDMNLISELYSREN